MNHRILLLTALLSASHLVLAEDPATNDVVPSILGIDEAPMSDEILTDMMEATDSSALEKDETQGSDEILTDVTEATDSSSFEATDSSALGTDEAQVSDEILTDMMETTDSSSLSDEQGLDDLSPEKIEQLLAELERENPGFMDQLAKATEESTSEQPLVQQPSDDEDEEEDDESEKENDSTIKE